MEGKVDWRQSTRWRETKDNMLLGFIRGKKIAIEALFLKALLSFGNEKLSGFA